MQQSPTLQYGFLLLSVLLIQIIITEAKTTTFKDTVLATSTPYGSALWSDANSWVGGVPADGDTVNFLSVFSGSGGGPENRGTVDIGAIQISLAALFFDDHRVKLVGTGKITVTNNLTLGAGSVGCALELGASATLYTSGEGYFDGATVTIRGTVLVTKTIGFMPPVTVNIESTGKVNVSSSYSDVGFGFPRNYDNGNSVVNNKGTITLLDQITDTGGFYYCIGVCAIVVNTGTIRIPSGVGTIGSCWWGSTTYTLALGGNINVGSGAYLYLPPSIYTVDPSLALTGNGGIWLSGGNDLSLNATLRLTNPLNWPTGSIKTERNVRFAGDSSMTIGRGEFTNYFFEASTSSVITIANLSFAGSSSCPASNVNGFQCMIMRRIVVQTLEIKSYILIDSPGNLYLTGNGTVSDDITSSSDLKHGTLTVAPGADLLFVGCCLTVDATVIMNGTARTAWAFRDGSVPFYTGSYVRISGKGVSAGTWIAEGYPRDRTGNYGDFTFNGNAANGAFWQYEAGTKFQGFGFFRMDYAPGGSGGATNQLAASTHVVNAPFTALNFAFGERATITGSGAITVTGSFGNIAVNPTHSRMTGNRKLKIAKYSSGSGMDLDGPEMEITESAVFTNGGYVQLLKATSIVTLLPGTVNWLEEGGFDDKTDSVGYLLVQGNLTLDANGDSLAYARIGAVAIVVAGTGVIKTNQDLITTCEATVFGSNSGGQCTCNNTSPWCYHRCNPATQCDTRLQVVTSPTHRAASIEHYGSFSMWGNSHLEMNMYDSKAIDADPDSDYGAEFGGDLIYLGRYGDTAPRCQLSGTLVINFAVTEGLPGTDPTMVDVPAGSNWRFLYVYATSKCTGGFATVIGKNMPDGMVLGVVSKSWKSFQNQQIYRIYYVKACLASNASCTAEYETSPLQKEFVKGVDKPCPSCNAPTTTSGTPTSTTSGTPTSTTPTSSTPSSTTSTTPTSSTPSSTTSTTPTSSTPSSTTSTTPTSSTPTSTTGEETTASTTGGKNCVSITGKTICLGSSSSAITTSVFAVVVLVIMILIQ